MTIAEYKAGDQVQVLMNNPAMGNREEWRDAEVLDKRMIYPSNGSKHPPYPILIVRTRRTYCTATPIFRMLGNIPVFVDNSLEFYEKDNDEGIIYEKYIRLKT
jgi:hypothetical protein